MRRIARRVAGRSWRPRRRRPGGRHLELPFTEEPGGDTTKRRAPRQVSLAASYSWGQTKQRGGMIATTSVTRGSSAAKTAIEAPRLCPINTVRACGRTIPMALIASRICTLGRIWSSDPGVLNVPRGSKETAVRPERRRFSANDRVPAHFSLSRKPGTSTASTPTPARSSPAARCPRAPPPWQPVLARMDRGAAATGAWATQPPGRAAPTLAAPCAAPRAARACVPTGGARRANAGRTRTGVRGDGGMPAHRAVDGAERADVPRRRRAGPERSATPVRKARRRGRNPASSSSGRTGVVLGAWRNPRVLRR